MHAEGAYTGSPQSHLTHTYRHKNTFPVFTHMYESMHTYKYDNAVTRKTENGSELKKQRTKDKCLYLYVLFWFCHTIMLDSGYLTILKEDVEQDNAYLVRYTDIGIQ